MTEQDDDESDARGRLAASGSARRQRELEGLERELRGGPWPDYQVIGMLAGSIVIGRQISGRQSGSPLLLAASRLLVSAGTAFRYAADMQIVQATLDGHDIATVLTLMRPLDRIICARFGHVEIVRNR